MTLGGWISMTLSIGIVTALFAWCVWKLATSQPSAEEDLDGAPRD